MYTVVAVHEGISKSGCTVSAAVNTNTIENNIPEQCNVCSSVLARRMSTLVCILLYKCFGQFNCSTTKIALERYLQVPEL
jgi:hypothetical protein